MKNLLFRKVWNIFLAFFICLNLVPLASKAQTANVTLDMQNVSLEQVINEIKKQTRYLFVNQNVEDITRPVSIRVADRPVNETLDKLFAGTDIGYKIQDTNIILFRQQNAKAAAQPVSVKGVVNDAAGMPVIGASVVVKGTTIGTSTGVDGSFNLQIPPPLRG